MLPCCIAGALILIQLMAFVRWFKRVILRKAPEENEQEYWTPDRPLAGERLKKLFSKHRTRVAVLSILVEITVIGLFLAFGGLDMIRHMLGHSMH